VTICRAVPYNTVMRRLGLAVALAGLAVVGAGCAGTHHANASMRPGGILASGNCWNALTYRGTVTRTRFKCSDYHPVVYQRTRAAPDAYELPIDPNHPEKAQWSTLVRTHPVTVGSRIRGIFPHVWVVVAVKPLPQDGQEAAVRGWRGKQNPVWHGRLVLRPVVLGRPAAHLSPQGVQSTLAGWRAHVGHGLGLDPGRKAQLRRDIRRAAEAAGATIRKESVLAGSGGAAAYVDLASPRPIRTLRHLGPLLSLAAGARFPGGWAIRLRNARHTTVWIGGHVGNEGFVGSATPAIDAASPVSHG
jgi:hypothetical protein